MSYGVDVNILLYASDASSPLNAKAVAFLEQCASEREPLCLAWVTVMSYLRMATHPAIFERPLTPQAAAGNVEALLGLAHCRLIGEGDDASDFWKTYRDITADVPARGNLVPDAHLAAILQRNGVTTLYTHDRDFRKFRFLDVQDPLAY
jgi:hypothetical protein